MEVKEIPSHILTLLEDMTGSVKTVSEDLLRLAALISSPAVTLLPPTRDLDSEQ
jgi:hypothetical protein